MNNNAQRLKFLLESYLDYASYGRMVGQINQIADSINVDLTYIYIRERKISVGVAVPGAAPYQADEEHIIINL